jgi:hypothetical protein
MTRLRSNDLIRALRAHPRASGAELCARLGDVSRATLTRALRRLGDSVVSGGSARRTRYALRRTLRGSLAPLPLYRIDEHGNGREIGLLSLVHPDGSAFAFREPFPWPLDPEMSDGWFGSLPYPIFDMRPQGFLGRNFARNHASELGLPDNPELWSDDEIAYVLTSLCYDQPGDLILGEVAYRRFLEYRRTGGERFLEESRVETSYPRLAEAVLMHGEAASSAGGEFPKFTAGRILDGRKVDVIVKFSGADNSPAVRRWADLLVCEHLAGTVMAGVLGLPATESAIRCHAGRTFLEVVRFDRHGDFGRSAVCSLGSLNPALVGIAGAPWPKTAQSLGAAGWLPSTDVARVTLLWWFGKLIGNTDMHEGNLAFRPGLALAPAYDMLPMMYAAARGGEVPHRVFSPELPLPSEAVLWSQAAQAAVVFWQTCAEDGRISGDFRRICEDNGRVVTRMAAIHDVE